MKLASIIGFANILRVTAVLFGWDVYRFLAMRLLSVDQVAVGYAPTLRDDGVRRGEDCASGAVILLQVDGVYVIKVPGHLVEVLNLCQMSFRDLNSSPAERHP